MGDRKISRITIKKYKSIESCDLDLKDIHVLVGGNGAGKSNLLSSLDLLGSIAEGKLQRYVLQNGGAQTFLYGFQATEPIVLCIYVGECGYQVRLVPTIDDRLRISGVHSRIRLPCGLAAR